MHSIYYPTAIVLFSIPKKTKDKKRHLFNPMLKCDEYEESP